MAGADIGGDDSVQWSVEVDHVRVDKLKQEPKGSKGWRHEGVDESDDGEKFTISIKIPNDATEFVRTLHDAAIEAERQKSNPGHPITFKLPIERKNHDQIKIRWNSKP